MMTLMDHNSHPRGLRASEDEDTACVSTGAKKHSANANAMVAILVMNVVYMLMSWWCKRFLCQEEQTSPRIMPSRGRNYGGT